MKSIILLGDLTQISNGITPFDRGCGVTPEIPSFGRHCQPRGHWRTQEDPEMMMMICLKWNKFTNPPSYPPKAAYFKNSQQIRGSGGKEAKKKKNFQYSTQVHIFTQSVSFAWKFLLVARAQIHHPRATREDFGAVFPSFWGSARWCPGMR